MTSPDDELIAQTKEFAERLHRVLNASFHDAPPMAVEIVGRRCRIVPEDQTDRKGGVPLRVRGEPPDGKPFAWLRLTYLLCMDKAETWMAVDQSKIWLTSALDDAPIIRFEYQRNAYRAPGSHIQVHGHRGALSHLLTKAGHERPHEMSALHIPTGGARFRPGVEDVVQFLIQDCRFEGKRNWRKAVEQERAAFRRIQLRAAARALPSDAAEALRASGYTVAAPESGDPPDSPDALTDW
jgi:hypothetical protein